MPYYIKERKVYLNRMPEYEFWIYDDRDIRQGPVAMFPGNANKKRAEIYCGWLNGDVLTVVPVKEEVPDPPVRKPKHEPTTSK